MRRNVIVFMIVLLGVSGTAMAQGNGANGILVGANFANVKIESGGADVSFDNKIGLVAGVFAGIPIAPSVALEPGVFFVQHGAKITDGTDTARIKLNYLEVPVLLRVAAPIGSGAALRIFAGPAIGFKLSAKVTGGGEDQDISDDTETINYSAVFGAGLQVSNFLFDARYNLGLKDLDKTADSTDTAKTRGFYLMAGLRF